MEATAAKIGTTLTSRSRLGATYSTSPRKKTRTKSPDLKRISFGIFPQPNNISALGKNSLNELFLRRPPIMPITLPVRGQERGARSLPIQPGFKNLLMLCLSRLLHWHTHGRTDRFHRILIAKSSAVPIFCKLTLVRVTNTPGMRFLHCLTTIKNRCS